MSNRYSHMLENLERTRRQRSIVRNELRARTSPRVFPSSPTAMAVKVRDPATEQMIAEALARRRAGDED